MARRRVVPLPCVMSSRASSTVHLPFFPKHCLGIVSIDAGHLAWLPRLSGLSGRAGARLALLVLGAVVPAAVASAIVGSLAVQRAGAADNASQSECGDRARQKRPTARTPRRPHSGPWISRLIHRLCPLPRSKLVPSRRSQAPAHSCF